MSCRASSVQSHWERLRPTRSGRSQAKRTTWIATSGGKTALGPAARRVCQPRKTLGEKACGPRADHRPLDAHGAPHFRLRMPPSQQEDNLPPSGQPGGDGAGAEPEGDESADGPAWRSMDVGSPFDYGRQGILYVAAHLPRPTQSGLSDAAAEELVRLASALGGRTLGLFSSRKAAERAAEVVRERTELTVLLQGEESLPGLVRRFRDTPGTCLFGVLSLWQGVDVPGDACQLVVIDRLPFPRPDEPVAAARAGAIDAAGGSGFAAVSVPIAAVRLAQGSGRLIRRADDRGVIALLDPRLRTKGYGEKIFENLPPGMRSFDDIRDAVAHAGI